MKRNLSLAALPLFLLAACSTEPSYEIKGSINTENCEGKYIYLRHHNQRAYVDSALITNGTFTFEGKVDSVAIYDLFIKGKSRHHDHNIPFVLENISMTAQIDTATFDCVRGGIENDAFAKLNEAKEKALDNYEKYIAEYNSGDESLKGPADKKITAMFKNRDAIQNKFIADNTDKLLAAMLFTESFYSMEDKDLFAVADKAGAKFLSYPGVDRVMKIVEKRKQVAIGKKIVDFEMPDLKGETKKLSDFVGNGKVVLIDFWASWCLPCRASMPDLIKTYNQYKGKGFDIVGISLDNKKEAWEKGINDLKLPWNQLSDIKGWKCKGAELYGVNSIPHTVLVDKNGIIVAKGLHGEELNKKIEELLK